MSYLVKAVKRAEPDILGGSPDDSTTPDNTNAGNGNGNGNDNGNGNGSGTGTGNGGNAGGDGNGGNANTPSSVINNPTTKGTTSSVHSTTVLPPTTTKSTISTATKPSTTSTSSSTSITQTSTSTPSESTSSESSSSSSSSSPSSLTSSATSVATTTSAINTDNARLITASYNKPSSVISLDGANSTVKASSSAEASGGVSTGTIVGGVAGAIAAMAFFVVLGMFLVRRCRRNARRRHRDNFNAHHFRRSAAIVDDPPTVPDAGTHTFNPRPPTMIERKMNTAGVGAGARGAATAQNNPFDDYQEKYSDAAQPQYDSYNSNNHGNYSYDSRAQYSADEVYQSYGAVDYSSNSHVLPGPPPVAPAPVQPHAPAKSSRLNRVSTVDDADVYGGI